MKRTLLTRRTCGLLFLLGLCAVLLFRVSANHRGYSHAEGAKPSICSHVEYNKRTGIHNSISSTAQLPLRELLGERTSAIASAENTRCTCGSKEGASEEFLYWHTPLGDGECLFEREKVLVCKGCGMLHKRYQAEQLRHRSGDDSLPGICPVAPDEPPASAPGNAS